MKIKTLENYIKHTTIPYPQLVDRARRGGLNIGTMSEDGTLEIWDKNNRQMILYFESIEKFKSGDNCLIATECNYKR